MSKPKNQAERIGYAILLGLFVVVSAMSSLHLLEYINLTDTAQLVAGYVMGAFATIVFGYITWQSVK